METLHLVHKVTNHHAPVVHRAVVVAEIDPAILTGLVLARLRCRHGTVVEEAEVVEVRVATEVLVVRVPHLPKRDPQGLPGKPN